MSVIVHDLSSAAVGKMTRFDLTKATGGPPPAFEPFEFHGCDCGVASFTGQPPWELHAGGDELIHVLAGATRLTVRQDGAEVVRSLRAGDLVIVPKGCWHRNDAPEGVTVLFMTPSVGGRNSWEDPGY